MKKIKIKGVDAFTSIPFCGNPAGVVMDADDLTDEEMQLIAKEMNYSETAFIMKSEVADFKVRFFSPKREVDLCGHATIATFFVLAKEERILNEVTSQETKAGILPVHIRNKIIMMTQAKPVFKKVDVDKGVIASALGIPMMNINSNLPIEAVSTGLFSLLVPIRKIETVQEMNPDFAKVEEICKKLDVGSIFIFTFETLDPECMVHARCFAPLYGINEDPVTGTASGALGAYLVKHKSSPTSLILEQGYEVGRPGKVFIEIDIKNRKIEEVMVGGRAIEVFSGEIFYDKKGNMAMLMKP